MKEDKKSGMVNNPQVIHDELWDHYSGLPNPMWYQHIKELEDEEENTSDSDDTEVTTE